MREPHLAHQNEQVVTFTLVELLTSFVFIGMALAVVLADEVRLEVLESLDPGRQEVLRLRTRLAEVQKQNDEQGRRIGFLERELAAAQQLNSQLIAAQTGSLPPPATVVVSKFDYDKKSTAAEVVEGQQEVIAGLQSEIAKLKGGGKVDYPLCTTNRGAIIRVDANANGTLTVTPVWSDAAWVNLREVQGIEALAGAGTVSLAAFARLAAPVTRWGEMQQVPCRFQATLRASHGDLKLYLRQEARVVSHFRTIRAG